MNNKIYLFAVLFVFLLSCSLKKQDGLSYLSGDGKWVDLTHDFSNETIYWPTSDPFKLETVFRGITEKGFFFEANKYSASEHGGTHIDSPVHFAEGKITVDKIPIESLVGPAVVIDVSGKAIADPDYQVGVHDILDWESANSEIPSGSILLIHTGYGKYWPDKVKYMGTDKPGPQGVRELHFPGLHPEASLWLVQNRKISAVGLDTPSIDYGQSEFFKSHQTLFEHNIPAFENVANLDLLPSRGAFVIALPMKIKDGSGAPLRIVAFIPNN